MKKLFVPALIAVAFAATAATAAAQPSTQNIPNPVITGIADCGVMKFNGKYYIGGVRTDGGFFVSDDLIEWEGPVQVINMDNEWTKGGNFGNNQIHANDMQYLNGMFHMYWSVNYWGRDKHSVHIAHAVADNVLGPYHEPVKDQWLDNRIDAHMFRDDDGKLYFYMVRFTDGNTVWARPMKDPYTFAGDPIYQYASLPATWERMDNTVLEGPWVIKYRDRYYMMYNANHTGTNWGNYQLGVAEADSPTTFNHGTKYPYPLLGSNQTVLEETYTDLLYGPDMRKDFSYSFDVPAEGWQRASFDDSAWAKGRGGFATREVEGSTTQRFGTQWTTDNIFLRREFAVDKKSLGNLALRVNHNGDTKVYLNGQLVYDKEDGDFRIVNLDKAAAGNIADGRNVIAVESKGNQRGNYVDVALFDMKDEVADDILYTPGQPNILRGVNGFEWWLIYMANKNREARSQYVNRIHFFGKTMYADGVTSTATEGYFPVPAAPSYGDTFDSSEGLTSSWDAAQGWSVRDGELYAPKVSGAGSGGVQAGQNGVQATLKPELAASQYLFEAGVNTDSEAGITVLYKDEQNWIKAGLRRAGNVWYLQSSENGKVIEEVHALPADFRFGVYHTIKALRNGNRLELYIDNIPAPGCSRFAIDMAYAAVPGLYSCDGSASFDGIIYTKGWDEHDRYINGWGSSASAVASKGSYTLTDEGLKVATPDSFRAFKGDMLSKYEFSAQVSNDSRAGEAGIYPVYVDENNYLKTVVDFASATLVVTGRSKGKALTQRTIPLAVNRTLYTDMKYTDNIEKGYTFDVPTVIDAVILPRTDAFNAERVVDNMFDKVGVEYLRDGKWYKFEGVTMSPDSHPAYTRMDFNAVEAEQLRFINSEAADLNRWIYKIKVHEAAKQSYNLRAVKLDSSVKIFVDGQEVADVEAAFGPSQVALSADGCAPLFNGLLRYDTPQR